MSDDVDAWLVGELNCFFARSEMDAAETDPSPTPDSTSHALMVLDHVRCVLRAANPRKASGPGGMTGRVLEECEEQLSEVFTKIFNLSIIQSCLESATIILLPKKPVISRRSCWCLSNATPPRDIVC